jgi:hypothetical protein
MEERGSTPEILDWSLFHKQNVHFSNEIKEFIELIQPSKTIGYFDRIRMSGSQQGALLAT